MLVIQMVIIQVITFAALVFVLWKFMLSTSYSETKRLQQLYEENTKKAEELTAKIEEAEKQYKDKVSGAEEEIRQLKAKAGEDVEKLREEMLAEAKKEKEQIINQALNAKEKMREEIAEEMKAKSLEFSCGIVQEILNADKQILVHQRFVEEILEELEEMDKKTFEGIGKREKGGGELVVEVMTPHNLNGVHKELVEKVLSAKIGEKITIKEVVNKEIIAGIIIKLDSFIIDGSLKAKLKEAASKISKAKLWKKGV